MPVNMVRYQMKCMYIFNITLCVFVKRGTYALNGLDYNKLENMD